MKTILELLKTCNSSTERRDVIIAWKQRELTDVVSCTPRSGDPAVAEVLTEEQVDAIEEGEYEQVTD